jgi:signal transduction histidine kinase
MTIGAVDAGMTAPATSLVRHKFIFCIITLFVLGLLLWLHTQFASILGEPSAPVIGLLGTTSVITVAELLWLRSQGPRLTERAAKIESCVSIAFMFVLTALLTFITNRDESPYFVLLAIPILQCAYTFGLLVTVLTIAAADAMIILWTWRFFNLYPPARPTQYLDGGILCAVYLIMGLLVWLLVNLLKANQLKLKSNLEALKATRERLITEEKFAAIGRLASGVAHEIRNPVAMISSSLATATYPMTDEKEREEMLGIAARESKRLESLTADFLTYARPSPLRRSRVLVNDLLSYISAVTRAHAANRTITIVSLLTEDLTAVIDAPQVEGAILNLVLNAMDATPDGGIIKLNAALEGNVLEIVVEDSGPSIPESDLAQIFEPFFTTKPAGTGLGLAIARGTAIAHEGDLRLTQNRGGCVIFSMTLKQISDK